MRIVRSQSLLRVLKSGKKPYINRRVHREESVILQTELFLELNQIGSFLNNAEIICYQKGNKMSLDDRAKLLEAVTQTSLGVRELVKKLRWNPSRVTHLLDRMEEEGLIELKSAKKALPGRPKKTAVLTPLGLDFLETHKKLRAKPLRARKEDFKHAVKDALYAERLAARGGSLFKLFLELNEIVHNIRSSSEASQPT